MGNCPPKPNNNPHATSIKFSKQIGDHIAKGPPSSVCCIGNIIKGSSKGIYYSK